MMLTGPLTAFELRRSTKNKENRNVPKSKKKNQGVRGKKKNVRWSAKNFEREPDESLEKKG